MDIDGGNKKQITSKNTINVSPQFFPDGTKILFESYREDTNGDGKIDFKDHSGIYWVDANGGEEHCLVSGKYLHYAPAVSPDGNMVLYQSWREDTNGDGKIDAKDHCSLYTVDLSGSEHLVVPPQYYIKKAVFSPDGRYILFQGKDFEKGKDSLMVVRARGGDVRTLVANGYENNFLSFSPDGKWVAYESWRRDANADGMINYKDNRGIYLVPTSGGEEVAVVSDRFDNEFAAFTPDSRKIVFQSWRRDTNHNGKIDTGDNRDIYLVNINGEEERLVVSDRYDNQLLSFFPDGKKMVFESWRRDTNGDGRINLLDRPDMYVIDLIDQPIVQITTLVRPEGSCRREIEVIVDAMFRQPDVYKENTQKGALWKTEFVKDGKYHFQIMGEYPNFDELAKQYPITFSKRTNVFFTYYDYRETLLNDLMESLGKGLARTMINTMMVEVQVQMPSSVVQTNGKKVGDREAFWRLSLTDLLKAKTLYIIHCRSKTTNWFAFLVAFLILLFILESRREVWVATRKVQEANSRLKKLLEYNEKMLWSMSSGVVTVDADKNITTFNRSAEEILGYRFADVIGKPVEEYFIPPQKEDGVFARVLKSKRALRHIETTVRASDGRTLLVGMSLSVLSGDNNKGVDGVIGVFTDLTKIKEMEEHGRRQDRLAAIGQMSAGIAHEIKNPLAGISTTLQLLRDKVTQDQAKNYIDRTLSEVKRLDAVVNNTLNFTRSGKPKMELIDINKQIDRVLPFIFPGGKTPQKINLIQKLDKNLPQIHADPKQIQQVFLNLILNAVQAMPHGGKLVLLTQKGAAPSAKKAWVEFSVMDTGVGIAKENLNRVFDPFFTTKQEGSGLGLSIANQIVVEYGGKIMVNSQKDKGTTFTVILPVPRQS